MSTSTQSLTEIKTLLDATENAAPSPPGFLRTAPVQRDGLFFQTGQKAKASMTAANHRASAVGRQKGSRGRRSRSSRQRRVEAGEMGRQSEDESGAESFISVFFLFFSFFFFPLHWLAAVSRRRRPQNFSGVEIERSIKKKKA